MQSFDQENMNCTLGEERFKLKCVVFFFVFFTMETIQCKSITFLYKLNNTSKSVSPVSKLVSK